MTSNTIKLRTKEYRISVDHIEHGDGSVSRCVFCNNKLIRNSVDAAAFPKIIQSALSVALGFAA